MAEEKTTSEPANKTQFDGFQVQRALLLIARPTTPDKVARMAFNSTERKTVVQVSRTLDTLAAFGWVHKSGNLYGLSAGFDKDIVSYKYGRVELIAQGLDSLRAEVAAVRRLKEAGV